MKKEYKIPASIRIYPKDKRMIIQYYDSIQKFVDKKTSNLRFTDNLNRIGELNKKKAA